MRTEKWYDISVDGKKSGYIRVVWSPSTWEGRKTVHDTTTFVTATTRDMVGIKDRFETTVTTELERSEDGVLWWMRTRTEEADRVHVTEVRWTGSGYEHSENIVGQDHNKRTLTVKMTDPVAVDAEALLGQRARLGTLSVGQKFALPQLDIPRRRRRMEQVEVIGSDTIKDEVDQDIACLKLKQTEPETGQETLMWLDPSGAFVRLRVGGQLIVRTTQAKAEAMPTKPAEYSITVGASPRLERVFNADRLLVDIHIRADEHRKMPEFPSSPWSRVLSVQGDDKQGFLIRAELKRYDDETGSAKIPVVDPAFARWLEPSALMQTRDPLVLKTVAEVVGDERDARKAAAKLARHVFTRLNKQSPTLSQAGAVQILKECRGDCSEHALLFVTLCRAAGIPARQCSGYVCIGGLWGGHAWAEIWTGQWIGADPTTGEVGTAARYLFFRRNDEPSVVSSRIRGRMRIVSTHVEEGAASYDLTDPRRHRIHEVMGRRYVHVLAGLEARDVPKDWSVRLSGDNVMLLRGPGFVAHLRASADQGDDFESASRYAFGKRATFAGAPAWLRESNNGSRYLIFSRRRIILVGITGADEACLQEIERVLAPTFQEPALAWDPPAAAEAAAPSEKVAPEEKASGDGEAASETGGEGK